METKEISINYNTKHNTFTPEFCERAEEIVKKAMPQWVNEVLISNYRGESYLNVRIFLPLELPIDKGFFLGDISRNKGRVIGIRNFANAICIDCEWEL